MALDDFIPRYKFDEPDLLITGDDGQPTALFWKEFPNGEVPIRYVPALAPGYEGDFEAWASTLVARYDAARSFVASVDECEYQRDTYLNAWAWGPNPEWGHAEGVRRNPNLPERKKALSALMKQGLSLRQIARYLPASEREVVETVRNGKLSDQLTVEQYLTVDEWLTAGALRDSSHKRLAARANDLGGLCFTVELVLHLCELRGVKGKRAERAEHPDYDPSIDAVVKERYVHNARLATIAETVRKEYPNAEWLTLDWVVWQTRQDRAAIRKRIERLRNQEKGT